MTTLRDELGINAGKAYILQGHWMGFKSNVRYGFVDFTLSTALNMTVRELFERYKDKNLIEIAVLDAKAEVIISIKVDEKEKDAPI